SVNKIINDVHNFTSDSDTSSDNDSEGSDGNVDYYGITDESSCPLCKLDHDDDSEKANKTLTPEYLEWEAKLTELPNILTDKIRFKLYKRYKNKTGLDP
ncbi:16773_t:CDS:2, partial [Entrophospora sp. SA101]